jgi:hypothetical protein
MSNNTTPYDPIWYAQFGLQQLEKSLGLAARVYRGVDKAPQQPGSVIQLKRPGTFTAQAAPSAAQDLGPVSINVTLDQWYEVKFALTDKELNYTQEQIINDHIRPAAVALADKIDQALVALLKRFPYHTSVTLSTAAVTDITAARRVLFTNRVPLDDVHMMIDGYLEEKFLGLAAFTQWQGAGDVGVSSQMRGTLGTKFGFEIFANQNVGTHTSGTCADTTGAIDFGSGTTAVYAKGATMIHVDGMTSGGTAAAGDYIIISGDSQPYAITAAVTFTGGEADVYIDPPLAQAVDEDTVVTLYQPAGNGATRTENFAFHRNGLCLAMAPLSTLANQLGARVETVTDPITGLSLRSRMYYDGDNSKVIVALDVLYGVKVIDNNMGVRMMAT